MRFQVTLAVNEDQLGFKTIAKYVLYSTISFLVVLLLFASIHTA